MNVRKWIDCSQEVDVQVGADDISAALSEAFASARQGIDEGPNHRDVLSALNSIGAFLNGFTDAHIAKLTDKQREIVSHFLSKAAARFSSQNAEHKISRPTKGSQT